MKNSKRWISGAMAAFLMLCAGCGQNSNGADSAAAETEQEQQQEPVVEQVEDVDMTLSFSVYEGDATTKETYEKEGKYTGQLVDGVPDGEGKFTTENSSGIEWYYEGTFTQGAVTGNGVKCWPSGNQKHVGHFVNGELDGNKADRLYNCVRQFTLNLEYSDPVEISDTAMAVIKSNEDIFPAVDNAAKEKAKAMIDSSIEYKHLVKNIAPYVDKMVYFKNQTVLQVFCDTMWGKPFTYILTADSNYDNYHVVMYDGDIDVFEDDNITFVALPVATSNFDNIGGGITNVVVDVASIIIKN